MVMVFIMERVDGYTKNDEEEEERRVDGERRRKNQTSNFFSRHYIDRHFLL